MIKLLDIDDLNADDVHGIWQIVDSQRSKKLVRDVAWSFEGNGIRTRTTFLQAFQRLGLNYVELPNLLKTGESAADLAGYMDPFFDLYVIRERNHDRLAEFAHSTSRPVINAMSGETHPCEVLTDGYFLTTQFDSIQDARILLWGPMTNVFKSWHALAGVLGLNCTHFCPTEDHRLVSAATFIDAVEGEYDVVITDGWPDGFSNRSYTLTAAKLHSLGNPMLLPTPPATAGNEIDQPISQYPQFVGYQQKELLLPVQEAIIRYVLS